MQADLIPAIVALDDGKISDGRRVGSRKVRPGLRSWAHVGTCGDVRYY
jgi:hypothetical protein